MDGRAETEAPAWEEGISSPILSFSFFLLSSFKLKPKRKKTSDVIVIRKNRVAQLQKPGRLYKESRWRVSRFKQYGKKKLLLVPTRKKSVDIFKYL